MTAEAVMNEYNVDLVITCGTNGQHGRSSHHYIGLAVDIRTRDLQEEYKLVVANKIMNALGAEYDVVLESTHIHIEFDPK